MPNRFPHNFYNYGLGTQHNYAPVTYYIGFTVLKNLNLKILEVGGGAGDGSLPVRHLHTSNGTAPPRLQIGIRCCEHARQKLWWQQSEGGMFDLIDTSNVLHATRFIDKTLKKTQKLLQLNGKLV
ncbi:hypothetical protein CGMCC3_g16395 [Colletotrichum fructicola]|nr:uncharacterized protein CGMCC3_g16395 [Colletotrichum fructicola]KAE9567436.1 hypothetical protein CGMCC3_g16395 [Colletotrichum fructicola]KAF4417784.1 Highly reducing polyketide synthase AFT9-1 [Colletotrichum fructicola]KAF4474527.1 hypothetical protein CGGC5_v017172 [Colletotrichum fructicola Nara gc5]KAF4881351.1 hypothetical protein CGCFRS4_v015646 [Colletotrichum fructicola]